MNTASRHAFPFVQRVFAAGGYAGERVAHAAAVAVEIVRRNPSQVSFAVQPRRWVVELTLAALGGGFQAAVRKLRWSSRLARESQRVWRSQKS